MMYLAMIGNKYLSRGKLVLHRDNATWHYHPSGARRAIWSFRARNKGPFDFKIADTEDPYRSIPLWETEQSRKEKT
jgi:hypothetical protein